MGLSHSEVRSQGAPGRAPSGLRDLAASSSCGWWPSVPQLAAAAPPPLSLSHGVLPGVCVPVSGCVPDSLLRTGSGLIAEAEDSVQQLVGLGAGTQQRTPSSPCKQRWTPTEPGMAQDQAELAGTVPGPLPVLAAAPPSGSSVCAAGSCLRPAWRMPS